MKHERLRLGSRRSRLAMWQATYVSQRLESHGYPVEIVPIITEGDTTSGSLKQAGGQGLFTKAIQTALLEGRIDLAVHSLKDLATRPIPGLGLAAVPARAPHGDVLVCRESWTLDTLPQAARVGTGSPRRAAQLRHWRPDLEIVDLRGNVETRLKKLETENLDAVVLAEAGLVRLELADRITCRLPADQVLPAAGQGALGIETRCDDQRVCEAVRRLDDPDTHAAVTAERSVLSTLQAGCLAPVGTWARCDSTSPEFLQLDAAVLSEDGRRRIAATGRARSEDAAFLGASVAQMLLDEGAGELIEAAH